MASLSSVPLMSSSHRVFTRQVVKNGASPPGASIPCCPNTFPPSPGRAACAPCPKLTGLARPPHLPLGIILEGDMGAPAPED